jgi:hypothetical protein
VEGAEGLRDVEGVALRPVGSLGSERSRGADASALFWGIGGRTSGDGGADDVGPLNGLIHRAREFTAASGGSVA